MYIQSAVRPHLRIQHILPPNPHFIIILAVEKFVGKTNKDGITLINTGCNQGMNENCNVVGCEDRDYGVMEWKSP